MIHKQPLRIGFVGVGAMGQCAHLVNYAALPECRVVALAEPMREKAGRVAARYGVPRHYATADEMLDREDIDAIVAIQPFWFHGSILPSLLARKKPVMIEKPLANTPEVADKLLRETERSGTPVYVAYHKRSDPAVMYAMQKIDALRRTGRCGAMTYLRMTVPGGDYIQGGFAHRIDTDEQLPALEPDPAPEGWNNEVPPVPYNEFVNYYIHHINLMRHLLGEGYEIEHVDRGARVIQTRSITGITGVIEMRPFTTPGDWCESVLVCFEYATIRIDLPAPLAVNRSGRVMVYEGSDSGPPIHTQPQLPYIHAMRQQASHFIAAARGGDTPLCAASEARQDLDLAADYHALLKSRTQQPQ